MKVLTFTWRLAAILGAGMLAGAGMLIVLASTLPGEPETHDEIRAKQFVLVNDEGKIRARLKLNGAGDGILILYSELGEQLVHLGPPTYFRKEGVHIPEHAGGHLYLGRRNASGGIVIGVDLDGAVIMRRSDAAGQVVPEDTSQ